MLQWQVLLKEEGALANFAKSCYALEEKLFFLPPEFYGKSHSKFSKNEPENIP